MAEPCALAGVVLKPGATGAVAAVLKFFCVQQSVVLFGIAVAGVISHAAGG